jgi:hypothetical protein
LPEAEKRRSRIIAAEKTAAVDGGRHPGFPRFDVNTSAAAAQAWRSAVQKPSTRSFLTMYSSTYIFF